LVFKLVWVLQKGIRLWIDQLDFERIYYNNILNKAIMGVNIGENRIVYYCTVWMSSRVRVFIDGNWKALTRYAVGSKIVCINNNNDILICDLRVGYTSNDRWKKIINIHPYTSEKMFAIRVISSSNGFLFYFFFRVFPTNVL